MKDNPQQPAGDGERLARRIGPVEGAGVVVASMVGSGIFGAAGYAAAGLDSAVTLMGLWIVGGIYSLCGALCYAELATRFPEAGGEYVYLREACGRPVAFLSGWVSFIAGFSGAIALFAILFVEFAATLMPGLKADAAVTAAGSWQITAGRVAAIGVVAAATLIHCIRLRVGMWFQNLLTGLKVLAVLTFVWAGLFAPAADWGHLATSWSGDFPPLGVLAAGLAAVLFSFSGWNAAGYIAEEVRDPRRNLVRALLAGTVAVTVIYLLVNLVYVVAVPLPAFPADDRIAYRAATALLGGRWGKLFAGLFSFLLLATLGANMLTGPRVYFSMARDGLFPRAIAGGRNRWGVPQRAVVAQGAVACVLLAAGGFQALLYWVTFVINVFATIAVFSVVILRTRGRGAAGFRVPLYPVPVVVFCAISLFFSVYIFSTYPGTSWKGLALIGVGLVVYLARAAWRRAAGR